MSDENVKAQDLDEGPLSHERIKQQLRTKDEKPGSVPRPCGTNIELVLRYAPELHGRLRFNILTKDIEVTDGPFAREEPNDLLTAIKNWLERKFDLFVRSHDIGEQLLRVARRYGSYNPVAEYLNGLKWDGVPRIDTWLQTYCRAETVDQHGNDITWYVKRAGSMFLISAVARALTPGCKVDTVLVLEGLQGFFKSTSFRILGGKWFTDTAINIGEKDGRMVVSRKWMAELAELAALAKSAVESQKAFLSQANDLFRPPYGKVLEEFERTCVFSATVNLSDGEVEYLSDATGNRRWWPIRVTGECNDDDLRRDRDQLWAEAVHRFKSAHQNPELAAPGKCPGERWWFTRVEQDIAIRSTSSG